MKRKQGEQSAESKQNTYRECDVLVQEYSKGSFDTCPNYESLTRQTRILMTLRAASKGTIIV